MLKKGLIKLRLYKKSKKDNSINLYGINLEKKLRASYTIEAAVMVPIILAVFLVTCNLSISLYKEISNEHEDKKIEKMWAVSDFYLVEFNKDEPYIEK
ncbi:hypothetical protein [Lachnobacterium bovis]|uniref:TadE-like protein n=1 Tax=Lachnobacterium bovis TaxID=140626 RepID=A0A1H9SW05_9FIRM|nr:hypothetical protein [Lachnobacterium bovis]SER89096.1 hypothetical protein SAMN02910429_01386 [Lachnobacterium bovis]